MAEKIEKLITNSLTKLKEIYDDNERKYDDNKRKSKLIFPLIGKKKEKQENGEKRISEQEARFLFVHKIENQGNYYYSVETPTKEKYSGFSTKEPKINPKGRSASIDVTLYKKNDNGFELKHMIEFKHGNVDTCTKDFLKLLCDDENCGINYYINIIKNSDNTAKVNLENTMKNLEGKYYDAVDYIFKKYEIKSKLKIFVCILNDIPITENNIIEYQIIDNENRSIKAITEKIK